MMFIKYKEIFFKARENNEKFFKGKPLNEDQLKSFYFGQYYYILYKKNKMQSISIIDIGEQNILKLREVSMNIFYSIYNSQKIDLDKKVCLEIHSTITNNIVKTKNDKINKI